MRKTFKMEVLSNLLDEDLENWLRRKYTQEQCTLTELSIKIAQLTKISVDAATISRWLHKFNIPARARYLRRV